jgi:lipopolysaccharide export system permease protein
MHDSRDPNEVVTMIAEHGHVVQTASGPKFYLQQGLRQTQGKDGSISWLTFDDYAIEIAFYGQQAQRQRSFEERTLGELLHRDGLSEKDARVYFAEAMQRLTWPALALTLPLMALSLLFSSEFNRRGQGGRMGATAVAMGGLVLVYFALRNLAVKYMFLAAGLYLLVIGVGLASVYVLMSGRVLRLPTLRWPRKRAVVRVRGAA